MIKILKENCGKLIKEIKYDGEMYFMCDINDNEYKLMSYRVSVVGKEDVRDEYIVLVNIINTMFNEGYTQEEMYEEFGDEFTEYRNKVFSDTYEFIKDLPNNTRMRAGIRYMINKTP